MKYPKLFEPIRLGPVLLKNRIFMGACAPNFSESPNGHYTNKYLDFYRDRFENDVSLVITGHIKAEREIDPYPCVYRFPCLQEAHDLKYFREMTDMAHSYGAKIAVQLSPGTGRIADCLLPDHYPAAPSEVPLLNWPDKKARALTKDEIHRLVESYGVAAANARKVGFDFVYIHCTSYLLDQFLTPCWNQRTDEYGGSIENRMRFMIECIESVKAHAGADFPMIGGLAMDVGLPNGKSKEDCIAIAQTMEKMGVLALHLRNGSYDVMNKMIPSTLDPECISVDDSAEIRKHVNIPVMVDGGLMTPENCEKILEDGRADMTGLLRPLIADPQWVTKAKNGCSEDIRQCLRCGECNATNIVGFFSTCSVNPRFGREGEPMPRKAEQPKKVLILGGGQSGMLAAIYTAQRGHKVTIVEKQEHLGGHILEASKTTFKATVRTYVDWILRQLEKYDIDIRLNTEADEAFVDAFKPDAIIVCTGSEPKVPDVPGVRNSNVRLGTDVLMDDTLCGKSAVIVGSGMTGCDLAVHLAELGRKVTLVGRRPMIGHDITFIERKKMFERLEELAVQGIPNAKLREITENGIIVDINGTETEINAETVILTTGFKACDKLYEKLLTKYSNVFAVGDCISPRKFYNANREAYGIATMI